MALDAAADTAIPSSAEILARATALLPVLKERAAHCEQLRRIPPETVADLRDAKIFRIAQPKRFDGFGYGVDLACEVAMEIGRACGSTAWMAGQWPGHQFMVGYFPLECQEEYWGENRDAMSSTASAVAKLDIEPERGGWRVKNSQMSFSSGCDEAEWIFFMTRHGMGFIPKSDFYVVDDWYVSGLRGTGSKSVVVDDAWIPPHRFVPLEDMRNGTSPGASLYPDNPDYRAPINLVLNQLLLAANIGMARGVLDAFEERVTKRIDQHTGKPASEGGGVQLRFAKSHAEVQAAMMFIRHNLTTLTGWGSAGHNPDERGRAEIRRNVGYASKMAVQSTQRLVSSGDASGMADSQRIGRLARDCYMAGLQANLTWDEPAQSFSRSRWGVTPLSYLT